MIFYTGDIHGSPNNIIELCRYCQIQKDETIIILGDVGANYYGDERDNTLKRELSKLKPTILCVHGNHEMRPATLSAWRTDKKRSRL